MIDSAPRYLPPAPWESSLYSWIVAAPDKAIADEPQVLVGLLRGIAKASEFTAVRPEAAVELFWKDYPASINTQLERRKAFENDTRLVKGQLYDMGMDEADVPKPPNRVWGGQSAKDWAFIQDFLKRTGQIDETGDPNALFTDQFTTQANMFDRAPIDKAARDLKTQF